jgi:membrane protein required for colicin V production
VLNLIDIAVLVVVGISAVFGLWRGLVKEVLSVFAWVAAIVVARLYSPHLAPVFESVTDSDTARYVLAFAILCVITLIIGALANHFMARLVSMAGLQMTDRLLGIVFGVARGVLIMAIAVYFAVGPYGQESWWQNSITIPYIESVIGWGEGFLGGTPIPI